VVVINEADSLSRDAQAALRRTMEKYMSNLRMILCANSTSRLIAPIKSRCLLMRVAAPSSEEVRVATNIAATFTTSFFVFQMHTVLQYVAKKVPFDLPPDVAERIIQDSSGNLRKAILVLEALKMQSYVNPPCYLVDDLCES
jgi:replication factor C subunit 3/5